MFQENSENVDSENKINIVLKEMFKKENLLIYLLAFLVTITPIRKDVFPFGVITLASCMGATVPIFLIIIVTVLASIIFCGTKGFLDFLCISILFFVLNFIFKPKISEEERNETLVVGNKLFISVLIYYTFLLFKSGFDFIIFLQILVYSAIVYALYKVFVNGFAVLKNINIKKAFSIEEVIAAILIFAIGLSNFASIEFSEIKLINIVINAILIMLGFKYGPIAGGLAGLLIGLNLELLGVGGKFYPISIMLVGILSGVFSRLGKFATIALLNITYIIVFYILKDKLQNVLLLEEVLIPSFFLVLASDKLKFDIETIFMKDKLLTHYGEHRLNGVKEEAVKQKAQVKITDKKLKEDFIEDFLDEFENHKDNLFYDDVCENEELIGEIFDNLDIHEILTEAKIIEIFKKHNNFIIIKDAKIRNDLQELIKILNLKFRDVPIKKIKSMQIQEEIEAQEKENKNKEEKIKEQVSVENKKITKTEVKSQNHQVKREYSEKEKEILNSLREKGYLVKNIKLTEISNGKIIVILNLEYKDESIREKARTVNIADIISKTIGKKMVFSKDLRSKDFSEYNQIYEGEEKFTLQVGNAKIQKEEKPKDAILESRLKDGKYAIAIAHEEKDENELKAKDLILKISSYLAKGFDKNENQDELKEIIVDNSHISIELAVLDLFKGKAYLYKNNNENTFIKNKKAINVYCGKLKGKAVDNSLNLREYEIELKEDQILFFFGDGILKSKENPQKDWIESFIKLLNTNNVQKIADQILENAMENNYGIANDDISIIAIKILKRK